MSTKKDPVYSKVFTIISKILAFNRAGNKEEAKAWSRKLVQYLAELDLL